MLLLSTSPAKPFEGGQSFSYLSLLKDDSSQGAQHSQQPSQQLLQQQSHQIQLQQQQQKQFQPTGTVVFAGGIPSFMATAQPSVAVYSASTSTCSLQQQSQQQQQKIPHEQQQQNQLQPKPTLPSLDEFLKPTTNITSLSGQFFQRPHENLNRDNFPLILPKTLSPPQQPQVLQPVVMNTFVTAPVTSKEASLYHQLNLNSGAKLTQCERKRRSRQRKSKQTPKVATRFLSFQSTPTTTTTTIDKQQIDHPEEPRVIVSDILSSTPFFNVRTLNVTSSMGSPLKTSTSHSTACTASESNKLLTVNVADVFSSSASYDSPVNLIPKKSISRNSTPRSILKTSSKILPKGKYQPQFILPHKQICDMDNVVNNSEKLAIASSGERISNAKVGATTSKHKDAYHKKVMKVKFHFKSPKKKTDDNEPFTEPIKSQVETRCDQLQQQTRSPLSHLQQELKQQQQPPHQQNRTINSSPSDSPSSNHTIQPFTKENNLSDIQTTRPFTQVNIVDTEIKQDNINPSTKESSLFVVQASQYIINPTENQKTISQPHTLTTTTATVTSNKHTEPTDKQSLKMFPIDFSYSLLHEDTVDASDRLKQFIKEYKNNETLEHSSSNTILASSVSEPSPKTVETPQGQTFVQDGFSEPSLKAQQELKTTCENATDTSQTQQNISSYILQRNKEIQQPASPALSDATGSVVMSSSPYAESVASSIESSPYRAAGVGRKRKLSDASDKVQTFTMFFVYSWSRIY